MPSRYYSATAAATELTSGVSDVTTTLAVAATTGFPASTPYTLILDRGTADEEIVEVTSVAGLNLTVTRGVDSSTAVAHALGASVEHGVSARDFRESREHEDATAAHGATGAVVGTTNSQTLTNKTISGADNTLSAIPQASVTDLVADLAAKAASSHTHAQADVTSLVADLAAITARLDTLENPPAAYAYASGATTVADGVGTFTSIALAGEAYDTDTIHDAVTNNDRMTIQTDGRYIVIAQLTFNEDDTSGGLRTLRLLKNGANDMGTDTQAAQTSTASRNTTCRVVIETDLVATDYFVMQGEQNSGSTIDCATGQNTTFLSVRRVSD